MGELSEVNKFPIVEYDSAAELGYNTLQKHFRLSYNTIHKELRTSQQIKVLHSPDRVLKLCSVSLTSLVNASGESGWKEE